MKRAANYVVAAVMILAFTLLFSVLPSASAITNSGTSDDEYIVGSNEWDYLSGDGGSDFIVALAGPDNLFGRDGNDTIIAGPGHDKLSGGKGDDILSGGPGNDILTGGLGTDTFNCGSGKDTVQDYSSEEGDSVSPNCEVVRTALQNWQYREHKNSPIFSPDFIFTKESTGSKRLDMRSQGAESIGIANLFKVFKKSDIMDRDISVTWERSRVGIGTSQANIIVYDGAYDRTSMLDFPNGANEVLKGAGVLGRIIGSPAEGWSEKMDVLEASNIDYGKSKLEYVTVLINSGDSQFSTNYFLEIRSLGIDGYAAWSFENPGITVERSGTVGDYGMITASSVT